LREPFIRFVEREISPHTLLITCGLPATSKTWASHEISKIKGFPILRTDSIRLEILKNEDMFDEKVASNMDKREIVYHEMFLRAEVLTKKSDGVILDGTFISQKLRRAAAEIATRKGMTFVILQTHCPEEVAIARILRRTKGNYESNALTRQAYLNNKKAFEPVDLDDLKKVSPHLNIVHLMIDTEFDSPESWYIIGVEKR